MAQQKGWFGLYYVDGAFSNHVDEALATGASLYHAYMFYGYWKGEKYASGPRKGMVDEEAWRARAELCLKRAAPKFPHILVALAMDVTRQDQSGVQYDPYASLNSIKTHLSLAAPYWDQVVMVDLADEPGSKGGVNPWDKRNTKDMVAKVRGAMDALGLPRKLCMITYTVAQSLEQDAITIAPPSAGGRGCDAVGLELFTRPNKGREANKKAIKVQAEAARARLHEKQKVVYVLQAFDRNGAWDSTGTFGQSIELGELNWDGYKIGEGSDRTVGYLAFNLARPNTPPKPKGGALWYPNVTKAHVRIIQRMKEKGLYL